MIPYPMIREGGCVTAMKAYEEYHTLIMELMNAIVRDEKDSLSKAANIMADTIQDGKLIYVFGTGGHSYICAEEMFYRAGGLAVSYTHLDVYKRQLLRSSSNHT